MSRKVDPADNYSTTLVKYVPSELIAAYTAALGILRTEEGAQRFRTIPIGGFDNFTPILLVSAVILGLIFTPLYLAKIKGVSGWAQLVASTVGFLIWTYTLGGAFEYYQWFSPMVASFILIFYTLFLPILLAKKMPFNPPPHES